MRKCTNIFTIYEEVVLVIYVFASDPSEFPNIWGKFCFIFYQCAVILTTWKDSPVKRCQIIFLKIFMKNGFWMCWAISWEFALKSQKVCPCVFRYDKKNSKYNFMTISNLLKKWNKMHAKKVVGWPNTFSNSYKSGKTKFLAAHFSDDFLWAFVLRSIQKIRKQHKILHFLYLSIKSI